MILLDTNVLINIDDVLLPHESLGLSIIGLAELQFGIEFARDQRERRRRITQLARIDALLATPWLPYDHAAAASYGRLAAIVAKTRPAHARSKDIMLAGHAHSLGASLVTLNSKDFELVADEVEILIPELRA
ncbi:twitching motility protein PilT [Microbacterium sp. CH12i]|uniref:PIN domain-containing protein n=1 Tax=Microbacterium sp. CH12i TaxID=1479651 RepID=UPI000460E4F9|nr:PIN domain-containing protein [Microbacterium sp. CH12i]KDA05121.1 twitching motility protein PilT [Microbacterium sp. CH12i]